MRKGSLSLLEKNNESGRSLGKEKPFDRTQRVEKKSSGEEGSDVRGMFADSRPSLHRHGFASSHGGPTTGWGGRANFKWGKSLGGLGRGKGEE